MPWPQVYAGSSFLNTHFVHPLKQRAVYELVSNTKLKFPGVEAIAVFGSSVTDMCRVDSDIDIAVWRKSGSEFLEPCNDVYDVVFPLEMGEGSPLRTELADKGVIVYVRDFV